MRSGSTGISQWSYQKATFAEADVITVARDADTTVTETALDGGDLEVTVVDDRDGRAVFTGVTTGTYRLTISPPEGYLYGSVEAVVVRANETTAVTAPLTARSLLSIAIRDAGSGAPVAGACIVVLDERAGGVVRQNPACADDQGRIRLDYYWPGRYRLFAYATDGVHGSQWVGARGGTGDLEQAAWSRWPATRPRTWPSGWTARARSAVW